MLQSRRAPLGPITNYGCLNAYIVFDSRSTEGSIVTSPTHKPVQKNIYISQNINIAIEL